MNKLNNIKRAYSLIRHAIIEKIFRKISFSNDFQKSLYKKGYYTFKIDIQDNKLEKLVINSINKYFPNEKGDTRLFAIEEESKEIKNFFFDIIDTHKEHIKAVSTIKQLYLHSIMGGHLTKKSEKTSSGGDWHVDHHFELYKIMIYLSDVEEKNGPFSYLEGSHSKLVQFFHLIFFKFFSQNPTRFSESSMKIIKKIFQLQKKIFVGKKGTVIVFNSAGIHRGIDIEKDKRTSLTAYIYPATTNNHLIKERNSHMKVPQNLIKEDYANFLTL